MRYYKIIDDDYIVCIGTGAGGVEITEAEYNDILSRICAVSEPVEGCVRRIRTDLTYAWVPMSDEESGEDEEITADELMEMLEEIV